jgi:protein-S-isoprenylcysteine O-methyltransferase Ste14
MPGAHSKAIGNNWLPLIFYGWVRHRLFSGGWLHYLSLSQKTDRQKQQSQGGYLFFGDLWALQGFLLLLLLFFTTV